MPIVCLSLKRKTYNWQPCRHPRKIDVTKGHKTAARRLLLSAAENFKKSQNRQSLHKKTGINFGSCLSPFCGVSILHPFLCRRITACLQQAKQGPPTHVSLCGYWICRVAGACRMADGSTVGSSTHSRATGHIQPRMRQSSKIANCPSPVSFLSESCVSIPATYLVSPGVQERRGLAHCMYAAVSQSASQSVSHLLFDNASSRAEGESEPSALSCRGSIAVDGDA